MSPPASAQSVTVVIPVRDGAAFLVEAIRSCRLQTTAPAEVIVVDDGSTDQSADLARGEGALVVPSPGRGPAAARNHGARSAGCELVAFLDADDLMLSDRLELQAAALTADPSLAGVLGLVRPLTHDAGELDRPGTDASTSPVVAGLVPSALTVRRSHFLATGGFDESLEAGEFVDWMARSRERGDRVPMLDVVVAERRAHAANLTRDRERLRRGYLDLARKAVSRRASSPSVAPLVVGDAG